MPHITASDPRLAAPKKSGLPQSTQQAAAQRKPVKPTADSVRFGSYNPSPPLVSSTAEKESFLHTTPGVKHVYAGLKGVWNGIRSKGQFGSDVGKTALVFLFTLPFALLIPGSHFLILPAYFGAVRAYRGLKGLVTGITNPDKILKPQESPEGTSDR